jgi:hypothetical protein
MEIAVQGLYRCRYNYFQRCFRQAAQHPDGRLDGPGAVEGRQDDADAWLMVQIREHTMLRLRVLEQAYGSRLKPRWKR